MRRPALDGVRALAVASVVAYHLGGGSAAWVRGGFLGVDVFFVLSGYLITGLLVGEHAGRGRIDLAGFWYRRARRLLPAALLVLAAVAAWVWWSQPPETWPARRADLLWTLGYGANWHFLASAQDYFATYTGASPLRHAWSLAVEEQFYLLWPLLVLAALALGRRLHWGRRPALVALVAASAASAVVFARLWSPADPSAAYYSTLGRAQELLAGAVLAVALPALASRPWAPAAAARIALPALAVLLAAMLWLPDDSPAYFHGGALALCAVTAALIAAVETNPHALIARALSLRPLVGLGRISYGVYLWHWPLVVALPVPADAATGDVLRIQTQRLTLTLAASLASYLLLERPTLTGHLALIHHSRPRFALAALTAITLTVTGSISATALPGDVATQLASTSREPCPVTRSHAFASCLQVDAGAGRPVVAVLGDSTALVLAPGLDRAARDQGFSWVQAAWERCTATGLLVLAGRSTTPEGPERSCAQEAPQAIDAMLDRYHPQVVLVAEYWSHHQAFVVDGRTVPAHAPEHEELLRARFTALVDRVAARGGRTAFVELPPPGEGLGPQLAAGRPAGVAQPRDPFRELRLAYDQALAEAVAARPDLASAVSVTDVVCPGGPCPGMIDGVVVRSDGVHYTEAFARRLGPILLDRVRATPAGVALRPRPPAG